MPLLLLLLCCFCTWSSYAQTQNPLEAALSRGDYQQAYALLQARKQQGQAQVEDDFQLGLCCYRLGQYDKAQRFFDRYLKQVHKPQTLAFFWQGKTYQLLSQRENAAWYFRQYLSLSEVQSPFYYEAKLRLQQCQPPLLKQEWPCRMLLSPLDSPINSPYDEFLLLHNPRFPQEVFFSSNRPAEGGALWRVWSGKQTLNSLKMDETQALLPRYSRPGQAFWLSDFYEQGYRGAFNSQNQIVLDNFAPQFPLALPQIAFSQTAQDAYFFSDSLVVYAAQGPFGGRDLFYSHLQNDGQWSQGQALPAAVNSPYDEQAPFLAQDGRSLFFSSFRPDGRGGYDVYRSEFADSCLCWLPAQMLGPELNSPGDELYFRLEDGGKRAQISSLRLGGLGGTDLYQIYFPQPWTAGLSQNPSHFLQVLLNGPVLMPHIQPWLVQNQGSPAKNLPWACPQGRLLLRAAQNSTHKETLLAAFQHLKNLEPLALQAQNQHWKPEQILLEAQGQGPAHTQFQLLLPPQSNCQTPSGYYLEDSTAQGPGFRLELSKSLELPNSPWLNAAPQLLLRRDAQGRISVCVGFARRAQDLTSIKQEAEKQGFTNLKIIPQWNGWPLNDKELRDFAQEVPAFQDFSE